MTVQFALNDLFKVSDKLGLGAFSAYQHIGQNFFLFNLTWIKYFDKQVSFSLYKRGHVIQHLKSVFKG